MHDLNNMAEQDAWLAMNMEKLHVIIFTGGPDQPVNIIEPFFAKQESINPDIMIARIEGFDMKLNNKVTSFPTFKFYKNGLEIKMAKDPEEHELTALIDQYKAEEGAKPPEEEAKA